MLAGRVHLKHRSGTVIVIASKLSSIKIPRPVSKQTSGIPSVGPAGEAVQHSFYIVGIDFEYRSPAVGSAPSRAPIQISLLIAEHPCHGIGSVSPSKCVQHGDGLGLQDAGDKHKRYDPGCDAYHGRILPSSITQTFRECGVSFHGPRFWPDSLGHAEKHPFAASR